MAVVQCKNNHYYDNVKFRECPHCAKMMEDGDTGRAVLETQRAGVYASEYIRRSIQSRSVPEQGMQERSMHKPQGMPARDRKEGAPVSAKRLEGGYTVGWLVCVDGADYGRDFPLYAGFNRIGREVENDVILTDMQVSAEEHCSVIYEERRNVFYIVPKAGSLVYADDVPVEQAEEIENGTLLTVGETNLELVVFCKGEKRWKKVQTKGGGD